MAKDSKEETGSVAGSVQPPENQVKIRWDDTNMRSTYANVCNVTGTREEIVLMFGMNQTWQSGQAEVSIQLADRVVMSPFVAKRMALLLNNVIRNYETQYGPLDIEPRRPMQA